MEKTAFGLMAACVLLSALTGCQSQNTVRGQSPYEAGPEPVMQTTYHPGQGVYMDEYAGDVGGSCYLGDCKKGIVYPPQAYRFQYKVPQGLSYPQANATPAVVQYPYYTHKGPDCFFYTGQ